MPAATVVLDSLLDTPAESGLLSVLGPCERSKFVRRKLNRSQKLQRIVVCLCM